MAEGSTENPADVAAAVAAAVAPAEPLLARRIEFHLEREPYSLASTSGFQGFRLETLNPSSSQQQRAAAAPAPTAQSGKKADGGLDPMLRFKITFRRIGAGLQNLGNTCYLNSVLQCLTYTEPLAAYCQSGEHKSSCRTAGFCAMCALQNHVMNALQSSGRILSPLHLVKNLRCISRNFRNARQEDAHEYMVNLLESMHKCCLPSGVPSESPSAYEKSFVYRIFGGRLRSQVKCTQCQYCSNKFDPFLDLSLEILKADSLKKALMHFTATEQLDGGERQYQCQKCKEKVRAYKQLTVHKAPYVLTIHLKRFGPDVPGQKIDRKVDFEPTLDLKPFVSDQQEADLKYTLYGVLVHAGWSTHSGHYYCFVRTSSGMWHSLDDNQVRPVSEKTVLAQKAYMLFYVRDRPSASKRSVDLRKDSIIFNAPGSKLIQSHVNPPIRGIQSAERKPDILGCSTANSKVHEAPQIQLASLTPTPSRDPKLLEDGKGKAQTSVTSTPTLKVVENSARPFLSEGNGLTTSAHGNDVPHVNGQLQDNSTANGVTQSNGTLQAVAICLSEKEPQACNSQPTCINGLKEIERLNTKPAEHKSTSTDCQTVEESPLQVDHSLRTSTNVPSAANTCAQQEIVAILGTEKICVTKCPSDLKRKKLGKSLLKGTFFGRKQLFTSMFLHKKKKHKRSKKRCLNPKKLIEDQVLEDIHKDDHVVSTSRSTKVINVASGCSSKKHSRSCPNKDKNFLEGQDVKYCNGDSVRIQNLNERYNNDAVLATSQQLPSHLCPRQNLFERQEAGTGGAAPVQNGIVNILTSLKEPTVPRWDDVECPPTQLQIEDDVRINKIGYILDEWDEEYDRGRRKKVRKNTHSFGGPNPFQEAANERFQNSMKKVNQVRFGNQPLRI